MTKNRDALVRAAVDAIYAGTPMEAAAQRTLDTAGTEEYRPGPGGTFKARASSGSALRKGESQRKWLARTSAEHDDIMSELNSKTTLEERSLRSGAFAQGAAAYGQGKPRSENPHEEGTALHHSWHSGHRSAASHYIGAAAYDD